ncbi:hypothetical protein RCO28_12405 [Streptomyces sp. LHD-70]|uniref:hypothetical protein n=1 Tax=Streptomyces sp. LHD-70 TaxID=3072140 RepID=UPI00280D6304|nr:hypothetical protein [Streptomyces sp. LHD-70]MDQ8703283.1 hypothetical protein [Streptomyces sp. LHD-70]
MADNGVTETVDGLFARRCTNRVHYQCRSYTFTFDLPDDPAAGEWTVVAAGVYDGPAYVRAHKFMLSECVDPDTIIRLTQQEIGEPGSTALYAWNDARDCTFEVEAP